MSKFDFGQMRKELFDSINSFIDKKLSSFDSKFKTLEQKFSEIKVINGLDGKDGVDGKDGRDGVDGKSVDQEEIFSLLKDTVSAQVKEFLESVKIPENGKDGRDGVDGKDAEIDVNFVISEVYEKLLENKVFISSIKGADGKDGRDGVDGKDVDREYVDEFLSKLFGDHATTSFDLLKSVIEQTISEIPLPKDGVDGKDGRDGVDGKSVEIEQVVEKLWTPVQEISEKVAKEYLQSEDFIKTVPVVNGVDGKDGKDGVDGKSVYLPEVIEEIAPKLESKLEDVAKNYLQSEDFIKSVPVVNGQDGIDGADGLNGQNGVDGIDGKDGVDGKDALQIEVLDMIEPEKSYPRNTYAHFNGGLVRSYKATDPLAKDKDIEKCGWHVVVNGISSIEILPIEDNIFNFSIKTTNGKQSVQTVIFPYMVYKGIWKEGEYLKNETATYGGNLWICQAEKTSSKPADGNVDWQLAVRKGKDGRDGLKGEKGDRGAEGRAGKDHYG